jgi:hypothetical protein
MYIWDTGYVIYDNRGERCAVEAKLRISDYSPDLLLGAN